MESVLISTLGSEPQVVALAVQLLLSAGHSLAGVYVLHTRPTHPPIADALPQLQAAFAAHPHWPALTPVPIDADDVLAPAEIDRFAAALYGVVKQAVAAGRGVHLLLAGGRKPMAMVGVTVAQLLLGPDDRVWYLHSDEALRLSGRFEPAPGDVATLVEMPLARLGAAPARFTALFRADSPAAARSALEAQHSRQTRAFVEQMLTAAERELAALAARQVLTVNEMAARLHKSPKTITNQLNSIYSKMESLFGLQPDIGVKREFLRSVLRPYFAHDDTLDDTLGDELEDKLGVVSHDNSAAMA